MEEYRIFARARRAKQLFTAVIFILVLAGAWRYPLLGYFIPFCMLLGVGIGLRRGRKWCDWYCPRGGFADTALKAVSPQREIPGFFKGLPLRIGFLSFLTAMMVYQIIRLWPDPYKIGMFFAVLLTSTTALGIILALAIHQRTWCYFCPIGSLGNWVGRGKYPLKIDSESCITCKLCSKKCPMQLAPYQYKAEGLQLTKDGDCLKCGLCVSACPKKALRF